MKVEVKNSLQNVRVNVEQNKDDTIVISLYEIGKTRLGDAKPGEVVKIGDRKYIALEHNNGKTAVITKDFVTRMEFGKSYDYKKSEIRKYVTATFYEELCNVVGKENIYSHKVNLMCDDGSNKNNYIEDFVSILTTEEYRRYRELIPACGEWWWTATAVTVLDKNYSRCVCYVDSLGAVSWNVCGYANGVRPFCVLDSSILV